MARIDAVTVTLGAPGRAAALVAALLLLWLCLPAASVAAGGSSGAGTKGGPPSADLLSVGVGYGHQGGSQDVREVQLRLRTVGYEPGPIDGMFGPLTEAAVRSFQHAHGLATDGVVGPRTDAALRRAGTQAGLQPVRVIQRQLRTLGYETGPIDGAYGPLTEAAVERFQRDQGLTVDGVLGAQTVARLEATRAEAVPEPVDRAAGPGPGNAGGSARGDAPSERPQPDTFSRAEPRAVADSSSPLLRPGYLALLAALTLVLLLTGVRARRRSERTPAPVPRPNPAATNGEGAGFNVGLACAVLICGLVVGAAGGALFAARSSPDDSAAATVKSLPSRGDEPERPSASRPKRRERRPVARARAAAAVSAAPAAAGTPAASGVPTSAPMAQETPVLGAGDAVAATTTRRAERPAGSAPEREPAAAEIARAASDDRPGFRPEDKLGSESPEAGAAGSR